MTQKAITGMMKDNERITLKVMSEQLGLSDTTVKRNIAVLRKEGIISRMGSTRAGKWIVNME